MTVYSANPALFAQRMADLKRYPMEHWGTDTFGPEWQHLCAELAAYEAPPHTLTITHPERKWELVSAYQKTVRRGDTRLALHLASGVFSLDQTEWRYFWQRITTTACEDVGAARPGAMCFVIACAHVFPPSVGPAMLWKVWAYLTTLMCREPRSRIYCQLSWIEDFTVREKLVVTGLNPWEQSVLDIQNDLRDRTHIWWTDKLHAWALRTNWRGQNMLKFLDWPIELVPGPASSELPSSQTLADLPDYAYDTHTRVGKKVIARLCRETEVKSFLEAYPPTNRLTAIADNMMFLNEGALIPGGLEDPRLTEFERRIAAERVGWSLDTQEKFWQVLEPLFFGPTRRVNQLRVQVINQQGYR